MAYIIGIDDTDSKLSRGTGFRSRQLASELALAGYGMVTGIIRHQLFVSEEIDYTSQNSSNSIYLDCCDPEGLKKFCTNFLEREVQTGARPGFCLVCEDDINSEMEEWGRRAKREVLSKDEAERIAGSYDICLRGVGENNNGIIGALAAVGLRKTGNDGRFIWQPGKQLKDLSGSMTVDDIKRGTRIDDIITKEGEILKGDQMIDLTDWVRSLLINNKCYIIVEKNLKRSGSPWKVTDKEYIRKVGSS